MEQLKSWPCIAHQGPMPSMRSKTRTVILSYQDQGLLSTRTPGLKASMSPQGQSPAVRGDPAALRVIFCAYMSIPIERGAEHVYQVILFKTTRRHHASVRQIAALVIATDPGQATIRARPGRAVIWRRAWGGGRYFTAERSGRRVTSVVSDPSPE